MDLLAEIAIIAVSVAFLSGLLITANTGSARYVKLFLGILVFVVVAGFVAGLIFSRGLLIFFLFHIIALVLITFCVVVIGAACGGGIYAWRHKKPRGKSLSQSDIEDYLPALDFSTLEGITEERALARILSGYYQGGLYEDSWYIHKSELSQTRANKRAGS